MENPRHRLREARRIILKVGSSVLTQGQSALSLPFFNRLAAEIAVLHSRKKRFVLVTSGAIAAGRAVLGLPHQNLTIPEKQAAAAVGQSRLIQAYDESFSSQNMTIAQILLTHHDLSDRRRHRHARQTLTTLLQHDVLPIVNENDSVVVEEIKVGDNDTLAALISPLIESDLLILLTDQEGLYDGDPKKKGQAKWIPLVTEIDARIEGLCKGVGSAVGVGGMATKIAAAKRASSYGIPTVIASGFIPGLLGRILAGEEVGTLFVAEQDRLSSRKHWIAHTLKAKGEIEVDAGAVKAILEGGKSLLPSGIVAVSGTFEIGEAVKLRTPSGRVFAQGMVGYSAKEITRIRGKKSAEIEGILGYKYYDEIIHRDDLVIFKRS